MRASGAAIRAVVDQRRGEIVLLVAGNEAEDAQALGAGRRLYRLLCAELPPARAARIAAEFTGAPRRTLYAVDAVGDVPDGSA